MDCSLPGSSVHGILQARVLEWGAMAFSCWKRQITVIVLKSFSELIFHWGAQNTMENPFNKWCRKSLMTAGRRTKLDP